jgi:hypothetical protein
MGLIQAHVGQPKAWGTFGTFGGPLINCIMLDEQSFFFKLT